MTMPGEHNQGPDPDDREARREEVERRLDQLKDGISRKVSKKFSASKDDSWAMEHFWNFHLFWTTLLLSIAFAALITFHFLWDVDRGYRLDVFAVVFIITYPCSYISAWLANRKSFIMRSWCRKHGWTFSRNSAGMGSIGHVSELQKSKLFDFHGDSSFTMSRKSGDHHVVLTRHSREHRGKQNTKASTFLFMNYEGHCPDMVVHGHHKTDLIKLPGQMPTVKFESDEFNSKWTVKSEDAKAAYDRLDQSTMEYLLSVDIPLIIEFIGGLLIIQSQVDTIQNRVRLIKFAQGLTMAVPDDLMPSIEMLPKDSDE